MNKGLKEKKPRKIVFNETIDSAINGYALGISFLGIGLFLLLKPTYFFSPIISYIVGAVIGIIGVFGTGVELSKSSKIKGMDNLAIGLIFVAIWLVGYIKVNALWCNIICFFLLVLGCYAVILGIIQGIFSIINNAKEKKTDNKKTDVWSVISQSILLLTQLCTLGVAILNVMKASKG